MVTCRRPEPTPTATAYGAHSDVSNLRRLLHRPADAGTADDGLQAFAEEICDAARKITVVSWEAIHRERFSLTPLGMYGELFRNGKVLIDRQAADAYRRLVRLAAAGVAQGSPHRRSWKLRIPT